MNASPAPKNGADRATLQPDAPFEHEDQLILSGMHVQLRPQTRWRMNLDDSEGLADVCS